MVKSINKVKNNWANITFVLCPSFTVVEPHIGIAYLCAALKAHQYKPLVRDLNIKFYNSGDNEFKKYWKNEHMGSWIFDEIRSELINRFINVFSKEFEFLAREESGIIGFSVYNSNFFFVESAVKIIKEHNPNKKVVLGGPGIKNPVIFERLKTELVDCFVWNEAEESIVELINILIKKGTFNGIAGTSSWQKGEFIQYENRKPVDINCLPIPTYEEFPLHLYERKDSLPILLSRGCKNRCRFCIDQPYFKNYRNRSINLIIKEIEYQYYVNERNLFHCGDLLLNADLIHLETLCDELIKLNKNKEISKRILLAGQITARSDMSHELLVKMKKAGFVALNFGIESFSDKVLQYLGKPYNAAEAETMVRKVSEIGFDTRLNIIVGASVESEEDFQLTLNALDRLKSYIIELGSVSPLEIYPTSIFGKNPTKYGISIENEDKCYWDKYRSLVGVLRWTSSDGSNTQSLRDERLERLKEYVRERCIGINLGEV